GKHDEAWPLYKRSLAILEKALSQDHLHVAASLIKLAGFSAKQGKCDEAEPLYERSLFIPENVLGKEHPEVAASLNNRAWLLSVCSSGKYDEADPLYQRALAIDEKVLGPEHPDVATDLNNRAGHPNFLGKFEESTLCGTSYSFEESSWCLQPNATCGFSAIVVVTAFLFAFSASFQGKYDEARPLYERSIVIREKCLGPDHGPPGCGRSAQQPNSLLAMAGKFEEAGPISERSQAIREKEL
ncbi:unnamed protein product, partial [Hapterophycus canaliculatus]